jgi:hypothetical protein
VDQAVRGHGEGSSGYRRGIDVSSPTQSAEAKYILKVTGASYGVRHPVRGVVIVSCWVGTIVPNLPQSYYTKLCQNLFAFDQDPMHKETAAPATLFPADAALSDLM